MTVIYTYINPITGKAKASQFYNDVIIESLFDEGTSDTIIVISNYSSTIEVFTRNEDYKIMRPKEFKYK